MASLKHPSFKSRSQLSLRKLVAYIHPRWLESPSRSLPTGICQPCLWPAASFPPWQLVWNEGNHNFISRTKLLEIASTSRFFFTGPAILTVIMDKRNIHKKESSNNKYLLVTSVHYAVSTKLPTTCPCALTCGHLEPGHEHIQTCVVITI